jgi:MFS family permease
MPSGILRLLSSRHRKTSLLVWVIFFGVAFLYYGVVLLTTSLNVRDDEDASGEIACLAHGAPKLSTSEYADIFLSSMAEIPGLIIAIFIIDRIGRRRSMGFTLVATAVCIFPLAFESISTGFRDFVLFCARSSAMAAFTVLYVFAGEVYPTTIRSTGVGVGNGFARIGGILCPVFAVTLIESGRVPLSVVFFLIVAIVSAVASFSLRVETSGRRLDADEEPGIELSDVST